MAKQKAKQEVDIKGPAAEQVKRPASQPESVTLIVKRHKCPRCGGIATSVYGRSRKGDLEYRECSLVVCRYRFTVRIMAGPTVQSL